MAWQNWRARVVAPPKELRELRNEPEFCSKARKQFLGSSILFLVVAFAGTATLNGSLFGVRLEHDRILLLSFVASLCLGINYVLVLRERWNDVLIDTKVDEIEAFEISKKKFEVHANELATLLAQLSNDRVFHIQFDKNPKYITTSFVENKEMKEVRKRLGDINSRMSDTNIAIGTLHKRLETSMNKLHQVSLVGARLQRYLSVANLRIWLFEILGPFLVFLTGVVVFLWFREGLLSS